MDTPTRDTGEMLDEALTYYLDSKTISMPTRARLYLAELWKADIMEWAAGQADVRYQLIYPTPPVPEEDMSLAVSSEAPSVPAEGVVSASPVPETQGVALPEEGSSGGSSPLVAEVESLLETPLETALSSNETTLPDSDLVVPTVWDEAPADLSLLAAIELGEAQAEAPTEAPQIVTSAMQADWLTALMEKATETAYELRKSCDADFIAGRKNFDWLVVEVMKAHDLSERSARSACSKAVRKHDRDVETTYAVQAIRDTPVVRKAATNGNGTEPVKRSPLYEAVAAYISREGGMKPEPAWEMAVRYAVSKNEMCSVVAEVEENIGLDKRKRLATREAIGEKRTAVLAAQKVNKNGIKVLD